MLSDSSPVPFPSGRLLSKNIHPHSRQNYSLPCGSISPYAYILVLLFHLPHNILFIYISLQQNAKLLENESLTLFYFESPVSNRYLAHGRNMGNNLWGISVLYISISKAQGTGHPHRIAWHKLHRLASSENRVLSTDSHSTSKAQLLSKSPVIRLSKVHLQLQDLLSNLSPTILSALLPSLKESSLFLQPHFWIKDSHQVSIVLQISHLLLGHFAKLFMTLPPQETPSLSPSKAVHQLCGIPSSKGHLSFLIIGCLA